MKLSVTWFNIITILSIHKWYNNELAVMSRCLVSAIMYKDNKIKYTILIVIANNCTIVACCTIYGVSLLATAEKTEPLKTIKFVIFSRY